MTRRKWVRALLWSVGVLTVLIVAVVLVFWLTSPPAPDLSLRDEVRDVPSEWHQSETEVEPDADSPNVDGAFRPFESHGVLALVGDGKRFGEEVYNLVVTEQDVELTSSGRFWFKVLVARVAVTFEQFLLADGALHPTHYEIAFDGPLGFDRAMSADFSGDRATIVRGNDTGRRTVDADRAFVVGTFSTYAIVPRLVSERAEDGEIEVDILMFGGAPDADDGASGGGLPSVRMRRAGSAEILASGERVVADHYVIVDGTGASELYARGDEFLALRASSEDGTLLVYRSDYFPDGVEFADD